MKQSVDLWITSAALADDHLTNPLINLAFVIPSNDHEVTGTDMDEGGVSLNRAAVIDGHLS